MSHFTPLSWVTGDIQYIVHVSCVPHGLWNKYTEDGSGSKMCAIQAWVSNLSLDPQHPCQSQVGSPHTCDSSNRKATRRKHMRLADQLVFSNQGTLGSVKNPISKNKVQNNWKHTIDHDLYMYPDKCVHAQSCTHIYREIKVQ